MVKETTKIYKIESILVRVRQEKYSRDTEQELLSDGYAAMPDGTIGCTKSFQHAEDNRYAIYIVNDNYRYLVLIDDIKTYIHFMREITPVSHIFAHFVKHAD